MEIVRCILDVTITTHPRPIQTDLYTVRNTFTKPK